MALVLSLWIEGGAFSDQHAFAADPGAIATADALPTADSDADSGSDSSGSDSYPRVTAIEDAILGKTFVNEDLAARLSRLETKAFGKASSNPDLGDRTDALQKYAEEKLHRKLFKEDPDFESSSEIPSSSNFPQPVLSDAKPEQDETQPGYSNQDNTDYQGQVNSDNGDNSEYPHITELETAILGKSFAGERIEDRLNRLETTAFGAPSNDPDLSARTDAIDRYAEKKLHIKPFQQDEQEQTNSGGTAGGGPNRKRQLLTAVGTSLINVAGMGIPGAMGMGMGMPGAMAMGRGLGPAAMGFGGVRVRHRQDVQQQPQEEQPRVPQDDPLVFESNPPAEGAKFLTKVGWCEVQVFGHTFPTMHLTERLVQLNAEIKFAPGKSNLALMDAPGAMIKAAQNHKLGKANSTSPL